MDADRYFAPGSGSPVVARGLLVGRSKAKRGTVACVRLAATRRNGELAQGLRLLGATGKASRLRLSATLSPPSFDVPLTATGTNTPRVSVSTGKRRAMPKQCRGLIRKLPGGRAAG